MRFCEPPPRPEPPIESCPTGDDLKAKGRRRWSALRFLNVNFADAERETLQLFIDGRSVRLSELGTGWLPNRSRVAESRAH